MVSTKPFCLIIIALLVLLLSAAPNTQGQDSDDTEPIEIFSCEDKELPEENNYNLSVKSFVKSLHKQPVSHNFTATIGKPLPNARVVTEVTPANTGIKNTTNVDLCSLTIGGCPIQPGDDFTISFDIYIDYFTQIEFLLYAENEELLICAFFEESQPSQNDVSAHTSVRAE